MARLGGTYTCVLLEVSESTYAEIKNLLQMVGYEDQFHEQDDGRVAIDMYGIAIVLPEHKKESVQ